MFLGSWNPGALTADAECEAEGDWNEWRAKTTQGDRSLRRETQNQVFHAV
jgi:hypothetical protein